MTTLYSKLFETNFDKLTAKDAANGVIGGIVTPYSVPAKDSIGISIDSLNNSSKIKDQVITVYKKVSDHIAMASAPNVVGFKTLCSRIKDAIELNKIFNEDSLLQEKLAEILTYSYISKNEDYFIYPEFKDAKSKALAVYETAKKFGLVAFDPSQENVIKTLLLAVFYKNTEQEPEKKPEELKSEKPKAEKPEIK